MNSNFCQLDTSNFTFENVSCPSCECDNFDPLHEVPFIGHKFSFGRCIDCSLIYQNPMLSRKDREHLYETAEYWNARENRTNDKKILNYYSYVAENENRCKTNDLRIKWITSRLPRGSRILDIACGDGLFAHQLNRIGYRSFGIDISSSMVSVGVEKYGIEIDHGDIEESLPYKEQFDAISCYTISNFTRPSKVFRNISKHLRDGGYFFFNFADCDSFVSKIFGDQFYAYRPSVAVGYSKKTIAMILKNNNLTVDELKYDRQVIPVRRLFGMLGFSTAFGVVDLTKIPDIAIQLMLPTGYIGYATRNRRRN